MNSFLALIIAVLVVGVVVYGLINFNGQVSPWFDNLPGFGEGQTEVGALGYIRYDISTGQATYHDGEGWKQAREAIEFYSLERGVTSEELEQIFDDFYLSTDVREGRDIYSSGSLKATAIGLANNDFVQRKYLLFSDKVFSRGAAIVNILPSDGSGSILGTYYVNIDGSARYLNGNEQPSEEPAIERNEVVNRAISWRDSVLRNPIGIAGNTFCATKLDTHYLLVDLSEENKREC